MKKDSFPKGKLSLKYVLNKISESAVVEIQNRMPDPNEVVHALNILTTTCQSYRRCFSIGIHYLPISMYMKHYLHL